MGARKFDLPICEPEVRVHSRIPEKEATDWKTRLDYITIFGFAAAMLFIRYGASYWSWHWHSRFAIVMFMASAGFAVFIAKRTSWFYLPILLSSLISGIYMGAWAFNSYQKETDIAFKEALGKDAFYSYICIVLAGLFLAFFPSRWKKPVTDLLFWIFVASCIYTLIQLDFTAYERGGFYGNASMNGGLIACLMPFALEKCRRLRNKIAIAIATLGVIALTKASIPLGVFAVVILGYLFLQQKNKAKALFWSFAVVADLFLLGWMLQGNDLLSSNGRYLEWKRIFTWWWSNSSIWTGAGLGTTTHLMSYVQLLEAKGARAPIYLWMHSEWLQIIFELGIIGLLCALIAYIFTLFKAMRSPTLFASLLGFGAFGLFDYPLRLAQCVVPAILVTALILKQPWRK